MLVRGAHGRCKHRTQEVTQSSFLGQTFHSSVSSSASKSSIRRFVITEKAPAWLKAATTAFTFKTLLRHYAKRALTPRSLKVKLGPRRNYHKGRAAIRHYSQVARCEVAQLAQSSTFPTMAAMISPFVPAPVITRSEHCTLERDEAPKHFLRRTAINSPHFLDFMV